MPPLRLLFAAIALCIATGCGGAEAPPDVVSANTEAITVDLPESTDTVLGVAAASPDLSTFVGLVRASGFDETLRDTSQTLTVFAPSNAAFAALGAEALDALRADPAALRARLSVHTLPYRLFSGDVFDEQTTSTLGDAEIALVPGEPLRVRAGSVSAAVVTPDLDAGNGVVHVVDAVLAP